MSKYQISADGFVVCVIVYPLPPIACRIMVTICFQQINMALGVKLLKSLRELQKTNTVTEANLLAVKFSANKAKAIMATTEFFTNHAYRANKMKTENAITYLTRIKGVGPWTVKV